MKQALQVNDLGQRVFKLHNQKAMPSWGERVNACGEPSCPCLHHQSLGEGAPALPWQWYWTNYFKTKCTRQPGLLESTACGQQAWQRKRKSGTHKSLAKQEIWGNYFWNVNKVFCYFHYCRSKDAITSGRCWASQHSARASELTVNWADILSMRG